MKIYKIFILTLLISNFFISAHSSQKIVLDKLFSQLIETTNTNNAEQYEGQYIEKEKSARRIINPSDNDSLNPYKDNGDALVSDALKAFATAYLSIFYWKTGKDLVQQVKNMHYLIQQV